MQIRGSKVKGLDLHLARLRTASIEFFGRALSDERIRSLLAAAIVNGPADISLTATIFSPSGEFTAGSLDDEPSVLVRTGAPSDGPVGPLRLATVTHQRPFPSIKHVGEASKTFYLREALRLGFDDAAFMDARGSLSEGTIWNLAFWDGEAVIWPEAQMLIGTTMGIVQRQLRVIGVPQRQEQVTLDSLRAFKGAAVMNSWTPGVEIGSISSARFPAAPGFLEVLHGAFRAEPHNYI
jgi:branched-subunit amino acid aminotransferase/4-amino-4-deoxychorismate lyase